MKTLWTDKKRILGLPISFTRYSLSEDALTIRTGLFTVHEEEVKLYRVRDISKVQTLGQRIFGVGTIQVVSNDVTSPNTDILNIPSHNKVRELLSTCVDAARLRGNVRVGEFGLGDHDCTTEGLYQ